LELDSDDESSASAKRATITKEKETKSSDGGSKFKTLAFYVDVIKNGKSNRYIFAAESEDVMTKWISRINKDKPVTDDKGKDVKVFGVSLEAVRDRDENGVPLFLSALLKFLEATALDQSDLFTKPPDEEIKRQIDRGKLVDLKKVVENVHAVAGLIQQYLHELPEPIIPSEFQSAFYGCHSSLVSFVLIHVPSSPKSCPRC
jgi:hypothetical protein